MSKVKSILAAAVTLAVASSAASAATFNLYGVVTAAFTPDFSGNVPISQTTVGPVTTVTSPGVAAVYQIDYYFTISNLAAGESGFGSMAQDVNLSSGLDPSVGGNWNADASQFTYKQPTLKTQNFWASNSDAGASTSDLKGIVAYIANPPYNLPATGGDPRATMGQNSPMHVGSIFVSWDGTGLQTETLGNVQYTTYDVNAAGGIFSNGHNVVDPNVINFGGAVGTPEPASLGLLGMGGMALLARRRKA